ncbi:MAG: RsmB/NOP family class I SAM-dependent RNA methyltransferase [Candidatus Bathyarchaeota archaeon]|jgi:16S rRNA (cytosine967-C5)-methyltransferase|nr:RsmB/NOP family class I SAM-dependent RNA methyltransferase [Candidatus Bathyarchaeota archaeon A05DMB-3]MDH7606436.1 RsmB/NOP family class I SAM-dependent RNA methyltransferase [Candidatus Bathyarchaeota archaeon]
MLKEGWTLAIEALSWMEKEKIGERLALARTARQLEISNLDALRFAHGLLCETARRLNFIDRFINTVLKPKAIGEFTLGIQSFLRLYVYQMKIAKNWSKIDVEEAKNVVRLARSILGWKTLQKVEPFLGFLLTEDPKIILKGVGDEERTGLLTFHPTWFVRYCFKLFGRKEALAMLEANLENPPTYIRLNTLKGNENEILEKLAEDKVKTEKVEGLRHAYKVLSTKQPLTRTQSFQEGLFYIQDKASCFAAEVANPKPNMVLLDVCAAPGAKTTYLAQLMQNRGIIYSIDYSRRRMGVWKNEVARMGVEIAEPIIADACNPLPFAVEADMVILDPPCTSTGAFAKLPSAKWRLTPRSIERMAEIQWQMLENSAEKVKPEGTLVYSTCSITIEENEMLIERFLKRRPEFQLVEISPKIGLSGLRGMEKCQRLYPHIHQCNGFFIVKLLRSSV